MTRELGSLGDSLYCGTGIVIGFVRLSEVSSLWTDGLSYIKAGQAVPGGQSSSPTGGPQANIQIVYRLRR